MHMPDSSTASRPSGIVVVAGLVASGKSTLSQALARHVGAVRLEADRVRGTLLAATESEQAGTEARWRRDLSREFETEIYADLMRRAEVALGDDPLLVLDACFPRRAQRMAVRDLAARHGVPFLFVQCRVPEATLHARLLERDRLAGRPVWEAIQRNLADHCEPPSELDEAEHLVVLSDGPTESLVDEIAERLRDLVRAASPKKTGRAPLRPLAVSFDCWSTLLVEEDWGWAHALRVMALQDAAREAGREVDRETAARAFDAAWKRHMVLWERGEVSGAADVAEWVLSELQIADADAALVHLVRRFEEASHTSRVVALAGSRALLAALDGTGIPCVLVCDTGLTPGRVVRGLLQRAGLLRHLRVQAFSDEVGAPKPDPRPFLAAVEPLGVTPDNVLHVGDLRRTDVAGARALGMSTVRIRARHDDTSEARDADYVVDSHDELARLLGIRLPEHSQGDIDPTAAI
jgi:FMN phosphatase YigB (HAD superfamily)/predicted kinase